MGVGNFFGMLPEEMRNSRLYGVELDPVSGRIAKQLYPKADITVGGFETTDRRDFFDLAIGNVPFGQYQVNDKAYNKLNFSIHNYFFAKSLDQVRPGGVVAFVTSRYTMDAKDSTVRRYLAQRAELLGAIRLPNDAFKKNAGAEVVSDIIFLQKRDRPLDIAPEWTQTGIIRVPRKVARLCGRRRSDGASELFAARRKRAGAVRDDAGRLFHQPLFLGPPGNGAGQTGAGKHCSWYGLHREPYRGTGAFRPTA